MADDIVQTSDEKLRGSIATKVLSWGIISLIIISVTLIVCAYIFETSKAIATEVVRNVFSALVPVIATWVGTVIAFYFGKENFETASRQINDMVKKITPDMYKTIPVKQVMIDFNTMAKFTNADIASLKLSDLDAIFKSDASKSRLPVVDKDCHPLFIIHEDEYEKLIKADAGNGAKLINSFNSYGANQSKGFVVIPETATLNDAQAAIKKIAACEDVFITKGGTANEPLTGWLTDSRILNFLQ